jgi:hypothetical protein
MSKIGIIVLSLASLLLFALPEAKCNQANYWMQRLTDARRLIVAADALKVQSDQLAAQTAQLLVAQAKLKKENATADDVESKPFKLEVRSQSEISGAGKRQIAPESKPVLQNYNELMASYHVALNEYLQHRQEVRQHAAEFHAAAQDSNNSSSAPIGVPAVRELRVQAQDACEALQQAELQLHESEEHLFALVKTMVNDRKFMTAQQYMSGWNTAQQEALFLRRLAGQFDQGVLSKQLSIKDLMHGKMQEAMTDGDYVETQKVYREQQRKSALLHYEVGQATAHSRFAMQLIEQLQALSPFAPQGNSAGAAPDQFAVDDESLEREFEHVQELYKQVQQAAPKFQ